MKDHHKQILLKVARDTVEAVIRRESAEKPQSEHPELNAPCGCFVTLKNRGRLRGCIGQFISESPLVELIAEMAKASATGDPRFLADPIVSYELKYLDIEISVLSPLERTDDPLSLRLGVASASFSRSIAASWYRPFASPLSS